MSSGGVTGSAHAGNAVAAGPLAPASMPTPGLDVCIVGAGRTREMDRRVAAHESGHCIVGRCLGAPIGGATIERDGKYDGRVWGPGGREIKLGADDEAIGFFSKVTQIMPRLGEVREDASELISHAHERVIELVGGSAAERLLYPDDTPLNAKQDEREALSFAGVICITPEAVATFLNYAHAEATALLATHRCALTALADALVERRTLNGDEIDQIIANALVREDVVVEKARRVAWAQTIANAATFRGEP